jgi:DNA mismatch repair protein MutS
MTLDLDRDRYSTPGDIPPTESRPAGFYSILFENADDRAASNTRDARSFFIDLNCDQIVATITAGKEEYNLQPFFRGYLTRVDAVAYRHEILQDLEVTGHYEPLQSFSNATREIRDRLKRVEKSYYKEQKQAWFLDAADLYCTTVTSFADQLSDMQLRSRGLRRFRDYLRSYVASATFRSLSTECRTLKSNLRKIQYSIHVDGASFTVSAYQAEPDYSAEVEATFDKFKQGAVTDYAAKFKASGEMNHIEAKILEFVAKLFPEMFAALHDFCANNTHFFDQTVAVFDREVQFYVAYLEYIAHLKQADLPFCYPHVSATSKEVLSNNGFDIALAYKLVRQQLPVVCNDFHLSGSERVLVVSGPNQGGKTTFARTFGQLHYLASLGCPVPGTNARLFLFDRILTHFEKEEKVENLRGKLEDDLLRAHNILDQATPRSIIIMNEIFTSTTIQDEAFLSKKVMEKVLRLGALAVWVTFVDELASSNPQTVSLVSTVVPNNPALRTFKLVRRPADGLAYAMAIAEKYGLTYEAIRERIKP